MATSISFYSSKLCLFFLSFHNETRTTNKSDTKQNKGSILKASVDYILKIRAEGDELKKCQETNKYLLSLNKKLYNRVKVNFSSLYVSFSL